MSEGYIGDSRFVRTGKSKKEIQEDLARALANTGAKPVEGTAAPQPPAPPPVRRPTRLSPAEEDAVDAEIANKRIKEIAEHPEGLVRITADPPPRAAMGSGSAYPDEPPTADQVAVAIVAAARELGADPEKIVRGIAGSGGRYVNHSIPRARAYAACAIQQVFPNNGATSISRWVGAPNPNSYISLLRHQRKNGIIRWWDEGIYQRVVVKLRGTI